MVSSNNAKQCVDIRLNATETKFLLAKSFLPLALKNTMQNVEFSKNGSVTFSVDLQQAEQFRDFFSDQLVLNGFDEDYMPNATGLVLETLIDTFFQSMLKCPEY